MQADQPVKLHSRKVNYTKGMVAKDSNSLLAVLTGGGFADTDSVTLIEPRVAIRVMDRSHTIALKRGFCLFLWLAIARQFGQSTEI